MVDYFFISSPLHLMLSANQAIQNPSHRRVAIVMSKDAQARQRYADVARLCPQLFDEVIALPYQKRRLFHIRPAKTFRMLRHLFEPHTDIRVFTGNDRRMEFQYAMHVISRQHANVEGIYLDEGAVTYIGHKSMHRIQHRYIDPLFKKIFYGRWYKLAITTGASAWVNTVCAAFPDAIHPLLRSKKVVGIPSAPFQTQAYKDLALAMLKDYPDMAPQLRGIKMIWTLPHEGAYLKGASEYQDIARQLAMYLQPSQIAIKPHPRITNQSILHALFPGMQLLEHRIGMEALLPLLDCDCVVAGDISSTLLTTRWLRPDLQVVGIMCNASVPAEIRHLYQDVLKIPMLFPQDLKTYFQQRA